MFGPQAIPALCLGLLAASATAQASLAGPRLFPRGARAPGVAGARFDVTTSTYVFSLTAPNGAAAVSYRVPLRHPNMLAGVLRIEEAVSGLVPMVGGGLTWRRFQPGASDVGTVLSAYDLAFSPATDPLHTAALLSHSVAAGVVTLRFRDTFVESGTPIPCEKVYELRLVGRSLEIRARSDSAVRNSADHNHAGFAFGDGDGLEAPAAAAHVPYMDMVPVFVSSRGVFVTRIVDWYRSGCSEGGNVPPAVTGSTFRGETPPTYYRNDNGELNAPIEEVVYLTVSDSVEDVMPVVDRPPSQYRAHLADRAVSQAAPKRPFSSNRAWVARCQSLGMSDMSHIKWDWSKWPFNLNDPDLLPVAGVPAGSIWGTAQDWLNYTNQAANGNWTFAPYFFESSNDPGYPANPQLTLNGSLPGAVTLTVNPAYNAAVSVRDANGNRKGGWNTENNLKGTNLENQGHGHPVDVIAAHLRAAYLQVAVDAMRGLNGYTPVVVAGAHTDAAAGLGDWHEIDQVRSSGFPRTVAQNLKWREVSFGTLKDGLEGPLFGENSHWRYKAFETYNAGLLDGTSRKIPVHWSPAQGEAKAESKDYLVVPDFELSEVATKASGFFGMGWETHFQNAGPWGFSDAFVDAWHTTLLSYGHAPYFGTNGDVSNNYWDWRHNLRSYYLCHGLSAAMRGSRIDQVRYVDAAGVEMTLSQALVAAAAGTYDLTAPRLVLRFVNGLEFKANHGTANWVTTVRGQPWTIPSNGFVGSAPNGLLALSAINPTSGRRVDYAFNPGHSEIIDRRNRNQSLNGFPGALLPVPASLPQFAGIPTTEMTIVKDLRQNRAYYAVGLIEGSVALGPSPAPVSLAIAIDDTDTLSPGRPRLGLRALLTDGIGQQRDVTGLCTWASSAPAVAKVGRFGGVAVAGVGNATITASYGGGSLLATRTVFSTRAPVLSPLRLAGTVPTAAHLACDTDADAAVTLQLTNTATGVTTTIAARPDPARKSHQFACLGLTSLTNYVAVATAVLPSGQTTTGLPFAFTTP